MNQAERIGTVQNMQEYIEDHLYEDHIEAIGQ